MSKALEATRVVIRSEVQNGSDPSKAMGPAAERYFMLVHRSLKKAACLSQTRYGDSGGTVMDMECHTARMGKAAGSQRDCSHSRKEFANRVHRQDDGGGQAHEYYRVGP